MTLPGNERVLPVAEGVISKIVSLGEWSISKVVSMDEEVVSKVVPMTEWSAPLAEGVVSPPDGIVSGILGRQCIQLWAVSLG